MMNDYNQLSEVVPTKSEIADIIERFRIESEVSQMIVALLAPHCQRDQAKLLDATVLLLSVGQEQGDERVDDE